MTVVPGWWPPVWILTLAVLATAAWRLYDAFRRLDQPSPPTTARPHVRLLERPYDWDDDDGDAT